MESDLVLVLSYLCNLWIHPSHLIPYIRYSNHIKIHTTIHNKHSLYVFYFIHFTLFSYLNMGETFSSKMSNVSFTLRQIRINGNLSESK